jgi:hypothetical protein
VKISILAFDLSDNATGRADLLARLLAPLGEVEVVGPRFDEALWRPASVGRSRIASSPSAVRAAIHASPPRGTGWSRC